MRSVAVDLDCGGRCGRVLGRMYARRRTERTIRRSEAARIRMVTALRAMLHCFDVVTGGCGGR